MPNRFGALERERELREAIIRATDNIQSQHDAARLLNRRAARLWAQERKRKREELDLEDELEELEEE